MDLQEVSLLSGHRPAFLPGALVAAFTELLALLGGEHVADLEHRADARLLHGGSHAADLLDLRIDGAAVRVVSAHELHQVELRDAHVGPRANRRARLLVSDVPDT